MISVSGEEYISKHVVPDVFTPQKDPPDIVEHTVNTQTATPSLDSSEKRKQSLSETKLNQPCSFNRRGKMFAAQYCGEEDGCQVSKMGQEEDRLWFCYQTINYLLVYFGPVIKGAARC